MYKQERLKKTLKVFRADKIISMDKLMALLECSERTVQRRLKEWRAYTSYNQKGRYYVLPNVPQFDDQHGLWKYKNAFFSKHGNLKETLTYLVNQSKAGLDAFELSDILGLPAHTFLSHYKDSANIQREKHRGLYIYFSKNPATFAKQKREREELICSKATLDLPSDADAVIILVTLIKHPRDSIKQHTDQTPSR
jgi:transcriptional antiterminator